MRANVGITIVMALVGIVVPLAGCGGGGGGGDTDDSGELEDLRSQAEFAYEPADVEELVTAALDIAARNAGEPVGDSAFAFAQESVLSRYLGQEAGAFADRAPAPPDDLEHSYVQDFRNLAGFLAVVPVPYVAGEVREQFHTDLVEQADRTLDELEWARNNRLDWAAELTANGETAASWFGLVAIVGGGGASMGSMNSEDFQQELAALRYLLTLAEGVREPSEVLTGLGLLLDAVTVADYAPPNMETRVEDGVIVTVYSEEAVAGGSANAQELARAIDAARLYFAPME